MAEQDLGYQRNLFILPFDHRGSFEAGLLGVRDGRVTPEQTRELSSRKRIVYDAFLAAVDRGAVALRDSAILVDQQYGSEILADARRRGITSCTCIEKSGQNEFDFEYGAAFLAKLKEAEVKFGKVLVRYNPGEESQVNRVQRGRLKTACDAVHGAGLKFMFELLVPATPQQQERAGGAYDTQMRPALMAQTMAELQDAGIEPDVWKVEGMDDLESAAVVSRQARAGGRDAVGLIILGRGEDAAKVDHWLAVGAQTPGVIGFAVGRTTFWEPVVECQQGVVTREEAVSRIADNYIRFLRLFISAREKTIGKGRD